MTSTPVKINPPKIQWRNVVVLSTAFLLLGGLYIFQRFNFLAFLSSLIGMEAQTFHPYSFFIFNKTLRLIGNDIACVGIIYVFFREQKYVRVAFYFFMMELFVLLPLYFLIKLPLEGDGEISSPLLSQVHRVIVNPILMILLMIAFWYQRIQESRSKKP
jgi:exosortase F-associated protein